MVICKMISLGIKHIVIFNVRQFLYLSIKLFGFSNFSIPILQPELHDGNG